MSRHKLVRSPHRYDVKDLTRIYNAGAPGNDAVLPAGPAIS